MNQKELDDSFSDAAPGFVVCAISMVRCHTVGRAAADRHFWYEQEEPGEKVAYSCGDTVNSPLPKMCVLLCPVRVDLFCPNSPIGTAQDLTRPHGLTRRDTHQSL